MKLPWAERSHSERSEGILEWEAPSLGISSLLYPYYTAITIPNATKEWGVPAH